MPVGRRRATGAAALPISLVLMDGVLTGELLWVGEHLVLSSGPSEISSDDEPMLTAINATTADATTIVSPALIIAATS